MTERLEQERLLEKRTIILHSDRVEVRVADRKNERTEFYSFEDITNEKSFRRVKPQPNYALHVLTRNAAVILFFAKMFGAIEDWSWFFACLASSVVFFVIYAVVSSTYIELLTTTARPLTLLRQDPSEQKVNEFIDALYTKRNAYLREHYYVPSDGYSVDGQSLLKQLLDMNVISKPEYDLKMNPLRRSNPGLN